MTKTILQGIARCTRQHRARLLSALVGWVFFTLFALTSCERQPPLHLYDAGNAEFELPVIKLSLEIYWDYEIGFDIKYDWRAEWIYGWDQADVDIFGEIGYKEPTVFELRRYYTGDLQYAPHTTVSRTRMEGTSFQGSFDWGFWDILVWNEIDSRENVQSIHIDEETSLDYVTAYTNQSMNPSPYRAPSSRYTNAFYEPEALFAAYDAGIEVNRNLEGFDYDAERNVYVKKLSMMLMPITYIYLTQVIIRHNNGRITSIDGNANLSGMARSVTLNTGTAGEDAITVHYNTRMKKNIPVNLDIPYTVKNEIVDVVGGRLMSFGLCNLTPNRISRADEVNDPYRHYMDVTMQFNNGMDSTFVFDVSDQVRQRYKGGVITVVLDMDTIPIPTRKGGSGFDAIIVDPDSVKYEFEM